LPATEGEAVTVEPVHVTLADALAYDGPPRIIQLSPDDLASYQAGAAERTRQAFEDFRPWLVSWVCSRQLAEEAEAALRSVED
jgi:hypothetical protein